MSFTPRFSLFTAQEKKQERSPDRTGSVEILKSEVPALIEYLRLQEGEPNYKDETVVKLRIAGWNATSKNGLEYINGSLSAPMPPKASDPGF